MSDKKVQTKTYYVCPICKCEHESEEDAIRCSHKHDLDCEIELVWKSKFSVIPAEIRVTNSSKTVEDGRCGYQVTRIYREDLTHG